jgi:diguanylate cyclase (GGDEF)-like protein
VATGFDPVTSPVDRLLEWERALLQATTLEAWLAALVVVPDQAVPRDAVSLLLVDPTHELRHLLAGVREQGAATRPLAFVPSLAGLAPHLATLRGAWRGDFHAADHALLLPGTVGAGHIAVLPLRRGSQAVGLYVVGCRDHVPFDGTGTALLDHAADVVTATLDRHADRSRVQRGGLLDPLTGWNSPRYLHLRLLEEVARSQRERGCTSCLVVDADGLELLADEFGHAVADRARVEIAARIESQVRSSDASARLGNDGFVVLLPATDPLRATRLADRILAAVRAQPFELGTGAPRPLTVSIGIAECRPSPVQDRKIAGDQLVADSIAALYRARQAGGDRYARLGP